MASHHPNIGLKIPPITPPISPHFKTINLHSNCKFPVFTWGGDATNITFTAAQAGTLTLVFDATFTGAIKVDGVSYNAVAGIANISITADSHTITKGDTTNIFYIKIAYSGTNGVKNPNAVTVKIYPNLVRSLMTVTTNANITNVEVFSLTGILMTSSENQNMIDLSNLRSGNYLVRVHTNEGVINQKRLKE